ncbi:FadR/GntR family transcriptional regulator [Peribacillus glennii]|uniref:FadR family transcriptional regulator n=1 Tax=Peribacillus glennii TaxID=2303991 RepID=A0A372LCA2_9BACI|nr:FadR/GntR family transcriptional regulator [Peribacillus glennii]RFU63486.1 FadR family transcriptional regulator [Peribacillus glennii]
MAFKRIKPKKIYEIVAEHLYESIKKGELPPGTKLDSIEQLALNFQVGRSAIREALSALRSMGLVEMRHGEGTYVKQFDPSLIAIPLSNAILMNSEDIAHLFEVRKILETGAAAAAAENGSCQDIKDIEKALRAMKSAKENRAMGEKADLSFHLAIAKASKNPLLATLTNQVADMMAAAIRETILLYSTEALYQEHAAIYEAIKDKNGSGARNAMSLHLSNVEVTLLDSLAEQ